jgi:hypothetical protein
MKSYIIFVLLLLFAACQQQNRNESTAFTNSVPTRKVSYDTTKYTKGQLYERDTVNHPLLQFYLSYPEWKSIRCIVAVDETDYWEKAMIGLIEKSGKLRIHYNRQKIYLSPVNKLTVKEGEYKQVFRNDTLEVQLSAVLEPKRIMGSLTGNGRLIAKIGNRTIEEAVFLVYDIEK